MKKLIEQLNNFVYDSEVDFFDINRVEAQIFINEIENFENKLIEFEEKVDKLEFIIKEVREYTSKTQMPEGYKKMILEILGRE